MKEPVVVIDKIINAVGAAMLFFMIGLSPFRFYYLYVDNSVFCYFLSKVIT